MDGHGFRGSFDRGLFYAKQEIERSSSSEMTRFVRFPPIISTPNATAMIVVREKLPQRANHVGNLWELRGTDLQIFCRLDGIDVRRPAVIQARSVVRPQLADK